MATLTRPISVGDWQTMFSNIYGNKDRRDYVPQDLLLHIQEEAARVDESLRKEDDGEIPGAIAHLFCWFLSFCNMVEINLEQVTWNKYHGACPYCGRENNCMCIAEEKKPEVWLKNPNGKMPYTLAGWQEMSQNIYGRIDRVAGTLRVWLHVHEELGELSEAFRLGRQPEINAETADCFMWILGFCNRSGVNLDHEAWAVYPGKCDTCHQHICQCSKV